MAFVVAAAVSDVASGKMKSVNAGGKKLLLANVDGQFYAMQRSCPHLGFNLCNGKLNGAVVTCPLHRASFDLKTGAAIDKANLLIAKVSTKDAVTYPVKIEGENILIDTGA